MLKYYRAGMVNEWQSFSRNPLLCSLVSSGSLEKELPWETQHNRKCNEGIASQSSAVFRVAVL